MLLDVFRIGLTPLVFLLITLAQRRYGHRIGGWLVGLPITSGPFLLTVSLTSGPRAAGKIADGALAGIIAPVVMCAVYAWCSRRMRGLPAAATGLLAALAADAALSQAHDIWVTAGVLWVAIAVSLATWPADGPVVTIIGGPLPERLWLRLLIATIIVAASNFAVHPLGPAVAGIIAAVPILYLILFPDAQRLASPAHARVMARSATTAITGTVGCQLVLASTLGRIPAAVSFLLALGVLLGFAGALTAVEQRVSARRPVLVLDEG